MNKPKTLNRGDQCPNCGGQLHAAYVPTEKEFARFTDRENPGHLPYGADTASPEQRADLGDLFVCDRCGYQTRFPPEAANADTSAKSAANQQTRPASGESSTEIKPEDVEAFQAWRRQQAAGGGSPQP